MHENVFRILAAVVLFTAVGISSLYRRRADQETGEKISRKVDGTAMMIMIRLGGAVLWLSPLVYLLNPKWMAWARAGLPDGVRWAGVVLGVFCVAGIHWLFSSIGSGITPTSATREKHILVTKGPYRWIRHPLYTVGSALFIAFSMMANNWFIALLGILVFILMAIRTPSEEANLIAKFGDEYREYMKRTGRFLPKLGA